MGLFDFLKRPKDEPPEIPSPELEDLDDGPVPELEELPDAPPELDELVEGDPFELSLLADLPDIPLPDDPFPEPQPLEVITGTQGITVDDKPGGGHTIGKEDEDAEAEASAPAGDFWALIQSSDAENSDPTTKWTYTCKRCYKATAGYGDTAWTATGDEFTAYNCAENINSTSGRQGNGVDVANLDINDDETDDFDFYPIQNNTPVRVRSVSVAEDGSSEYWIIGCGMPNGIDGECP